MLKFHKHFPKMSYNPATLRQLQTCKITESQLLIHFPGISENPVISGQLLRPVGFKTENYKFKILIFLN